MLHKLQERPIIDFQEKWNYVCCHFKNICKKFINDFIIFVYFSYMIHLPWETFVFILHWENCKDDVHEIGIYSSSVDLNLYGTMQNTCHFSFCKIKIMLNCAHQFVLIFDTKIFPTFVT